MTLSLFKHLFEYGTKHKFVRIICQLSCRAYTTRQSFRIYIFFFWFIHYKTWISIWLRFRFFCFFFLCSVVALESWKCGAMPRIDIFGCLIGELNLGDDFPHLLRHRRRPSAVCLFRLIWPDFAELACCQCRNYPRPVNARTGRPHCFCES